MDCWIIAIQGDSLVVVVNVTVVFAVCCMLDTVNDKAVSCTWDDGTNKENGYNLYPVVRVCVWVLNEPTHRQNDPTTQEPSRRGLLGKYGGRLAGAD